MSALNDLLRKELQENPDNWEIRMELVRHLASRGNPREAIEVSRLAPAPPPPEFSAEVQALASAVPLPAPQQPLPPPPPPPPPAAAPLASASLPADSLAVHEPAMESYMESYMEPYLPTAPLAASEVNEQNQRKAQISAFSLALIVHVVIAAVLTMYLLKSPKEELPVITGIAAAAVEDQITPPEITQNPKRRTPSASAPKISVVASTNRSSFAIPTVDEPVEITGIGFGEDLGMGMGFGPGAGAGGGPVTFFGNRSAAKRVVFAVDVSASMSKEQLSLMKAELTSALKGLPSNMNYQVIFFSGPAWYAHQEMEVKPSGKNRAAVIRDGTKRHHWQSKSGRAQDFKYEDGKKPLPSSDWLPSRKANLAKTQKQVTKVDRSYGTSWRVPISLALAMKPKPDVIYFMTDGRVGSAAQDVEEITKLNKKTPGKKTKIFTTSMMEPKAQKELKALAEKNGGDFSMVLSGGKLVNSKGKEIERKKKKGSN